MNPIIYHDLNKKQKIFTLRETNDKYDVQHNWVSCFVKESTLLLRGQWWNFQNNQNNVVITATSLSSKSHLCTSKYCHFYN